MVDFGTQISIWTCKNLLLTPQNIFYLITLQGGGLKLLLLVYEWSYPKHHEDIKEFPQVDFKIEAVIHCAPWFTLLPLPLHIWFADHKVNQKLQYHKIVSVDERASVICLVSNWFSVLFRCYWPIFLLLTSFVFYTAPKREILFLTLDRVSWHLKWR